MLLTTDTSEKGLETLICRSLTGQGWWTAPEAAPGAHERPASYSAGFVHGRSEDYDKDHAVDLAKLLQFLKLTQGKTFAQLGLGEPGPSRTQFLHRLQGETAKRGVIDVLRKGIKCGPAHVDLFYGSPTPGNDEAKARFNSNVFSITRQLHYSKDETKLSLDLCLFINGLPIATFELKNSLTKQTVDDAVQQYMRDRDARELLFQFKRCVVHFAVDDHEVRMCTHLKGTDGWFLPFNKGYNHGAGNPPNPNGLKTDYLWKEVLTRKGLTEILENYAQVVEEVNPRTGKKKEVQIFPRYHQLDVVRKLLADVAADGVGKRYLVQHSAGSGKSNSIAWLAHQLVSLRRNNKPVVETVVVVTDRVNLDRQIRDTIKQFAQVSATIGHADSSSQLADFISGGKKIIITTVQMFPFVLGKLAESQHKGRKFAIIIDEAHSSQGGRTAAQMNIALSGGMDSEEEESTEDKINKLMEGRKMLDNASYFAFTATPKNKTLEVFGVPFVEGEKTKFRPFHSYTMKQAIQEGFILDVLQNYTPVSTFYRLIKTVEDDPEFDARRAQTKLRAYVEGNSHAIRHKAEIMVDHFHDQVIVKRKLKGQARAMVITSGIARAIEYYHAISSYLTERKSPYRAIVAFSGEHNYGGKAVTEASLNGFPSNDIEDKIQDDPYRFLVVADKFQTGYDEPLLHTMYVDKPLSGIKAVQTLSRLNRAAPGKLDTFVLDFYNDVDTIRSAFSDYYRTTVLSEETDPNKLHDLKATLDSHQVYSEEDVDKLVGLFLAGADRDKLDPILDGCLPAYKDLDEDGQVVFKGKAKAFIRIYGFLSSILPYSLAEWEKLAIFLNFLVPKLPAPEEQDLSKGVLETIDLDSYRNEVQAKISIALDDADAEIGPVPTSGGGGKPEPEIDLLSNIVKAFNDQFGNIQWQDQDKIRQLITEEIPAKVAADKKYQNAIQNNDKQNARIEHDEALKRVMNSIILDHTELFKHFVEDPGFKKWLEESVFQVTYHPG